MDDAYLLELVLRRRDGGPDAVDLAVTATGSDGPELTFVRLLPGEAVLLPMPGRGTLGCIAYDERGEEAAAPRPRPGSFSVAAREDRATPDGAPVALEEPFDDLAAWIRRRDALRSRDLARLAVPFDPCGPY